MYLSADDARSDFFLAAAVYVIGPTLLGLLLGVLPLFGNVVIATILSVLVPFLTIAAMPLFLLRYREESFDVLRGGGPGAVVGGLALGAVFAGAVVVAALLGGGSALLSESLPLFVVAGMVVQWLSTAVLAVFLFRRAEYAFRPISESQQTLVRQAGLACVGTAVVSTVLLLLASRPIVSILPAVGLVGFFFLAERQLPQQGVGERWWVWAPVITLALGPLEILSLLFGGSDFLVSAQQASVVALFGLVTVMAMHNRRGGLFAFGMAAAFLVADVLALSGGTRFAI